MRKRKDGMRMRHRPNRQRWEVWRDDEGRAVHVFSFRKEKNAVEWLKARNPKDRKRIELEDRI